MKTTILLLLTALSCGAKITVMYTFQPSFQTVIQTNSSASIVQMTADAYYPTNLPSAFIQCEPDDQSPTNIIISTNFQGTIEINGHRVKSDILRGWLEALDNCVFITNNINYSYITNSFPLPTIDVSRNCYIARSNNPDALNQWLSFVCVTNDVGLTYKLIYVPLKSKCGEGNSGFKTVIDAEIARTNYCADMTMVFNQ
jgi:hypothetical protein